jgi:hypothetical protein
MAFLPHLQRVEEGKIRFGEKNPRKIAIHPTFGYIRDCSISDG